VMVAENGENFKGKWDVLLHLQIEFKSDITIFIYISRNSVFYRFMCLFVL
jgi:hypothetical protein